MEMFKMIFGSFFLFVMILSVLPLPYYSCPPHALKMQYSHENLHRHLIIMIVFQNIFDMTGKCCLIGLRIAGISADNVRILPLHPEA